MRVWRRAICLIAQAAALSDQQTGASKQLAPQSRIRIRILI